MEAEEFELLGLNKYEALAYEALVRLGKSGASEIARESGVPYGRVYDTIHALVAKSLVAVIPEKTKKFVATSPEVLEKLLTDKLKKIGQVQKNIQNLKNVYVQAGEEPVEIVQGKRNFYKLINKMPDPKKYSYNFRFASEIKPDRIVVIKKYLKSGVDIKTLVQHTELTSANIHRLKKLLPKVKRKKFDFDKVAAQIIDDKAVFFALVESNTTVLIRDKPFARLMKKLFEAAWEKAEEI